MKNYILDTILVPTDFSETADNALMQAIVLSKKTGAKIILLHVVESNLFASPIDMISLGYMITQMTLDSKTNLKSLAARVKNEHDINIEYASFSGNVYENIIQAVHLFDANLIVMGAHGTSGIKEWLFGSTAFSVVSNATIPVLTFNLNSNKSNFNKIVFPFNENLITLKKIEQVMVLAKIFNATIMLFGFTDSHLISNMSIMRIKGNNLQKILADEGISNSLTLLHGDDYADEILKFSNSENADIITVVASKNHSADKDFKLKPDKKLVNHSEIPVLCVPILE